MAWAALGCLIASGVCFGHSMILTTVFAGITFALAIFLSRYRRTARGSLFLLGHAVMIGGSTILLLIAEEATFGLFVRLFVSIAGVTGFYGLCLLFVFGYGLLLMFIVANQRPK